MKKLVFTSLLTIAGYLVMPSVTDAHKKVDCSYFKHSSKQVLSLEGHADLLFGRMNREFHNLKIQKIRYNPRTNIGIADFSFGKFEASYNDRVKLDELTKEVTIKANSEIKFSSGYLQLGWRYSTVTEDFIITSINLHVDDKCPPLRAYAPLIDEDEFKYRVYSPKTTQQLRGLVQKVIQQVVPKIPR